MVSETLMMIIGVIFVLIFFWLLLKSIPKRRQMTAVEKYAYELESGKHIWKQNLTLKERRADQERRATSQAKKAFERLSGESYENLLR